MVRIRVSPMVLAVSCLALVLALPVQSAEPDYELKVAQPGPQVDYTDSFPTDVQATARLWNQIKIDAVEEQTRALREDFEKHKSVWFERSDTLATRCGNISASMQPQLSVTEQMLYSSYQPSYRFYRWGR